MRLGIELENENVLRGGLEVRRTMVLCLAAAILMTSCTKRPEASAPALVRAGDANTEASSRANTLLPPDLNNCTRIDVQYLPSALQRFFPTEKDLKLLNASEDEYLQSLETIIVDDPERIKMFARDIRAGSFGGTGRSFSMGPLARILCHPDARDGKPFFLFVFDATITTMDGRCFDYPVDRHANSRGPFRQALLALTPQIRALDLRKRCAEHIEGLFTHIDMRTEQLPKEPIRYPAVSTWCDAVIDHYRAEYAEGSIERLFRCPGVQEGKSNCAMNPNCRPGSPPDMVLLFETKGGWNQHGGPELFTFDNHDPRGGLVLLNDGTVKFIRTDEELKQLRWK
jgi:hypothetical protein